MNGQKIKRFLLLAGVAFSGLALLSWTQPWYDLELIDSQQITVAGDVAAPALTALALTGLVLVGCLTIAGPFFRVILGSLQVLLGFTIAFESFLAIQDPIEASGAAVSTATGVAGDQLADQVASFSATVWPVVALVAGILVMIAGIAVVVAARSWPGSSRKYQAVRLEPVEGERSSIDDWDALSGGNDPTDSAR
jgi:uncharacterized membrane protein (TIGR02234 family)